MKVSVLGTEYTVIKDASKADYVQLHDCYGFNDETSKTIVIGGLVPCEEKDDLYDTKIFENKVLRHEIIHAFLNESGLAECSEWARNEEMIDFFARQIDKINKAIEDCKSSD